MIINQLHSVPNDLVLKESPQILNLCKMMHNFILNKHAKIKRNWAKNNTIMVIMFKNSVV